MRKSLVRSISALLVGITLCASFSGCAKEQEKAESTKPAAIEPMKAEEAKALSFDIIGGNDVMPIAAYYGPYVSTYSKNGESQPEMINDEYYQMIQECGVNLIVYSATDYEYTPEFVLKMLALGETYGVGHFVTDTKVHTNALALNELAERISNYANYPAFCGIHVVDEPYLEGIIGDGTKDMKDYAPVFEKLNTLGVTAGSNLLPNWVFYSNEDFEKYVDTFVTTCDIPYLSFDYYVFDKNRNVAEYFYNLSVNREAANKAGVPLWVFIQAGSQWNDANGRFDSETPYYPNEKQFDWNINTSLAYGAKGIEYFPLVQPYWFAWAESTDFDFERNSLIGAWGNKTQWFYYAKDIQPHIAAIDEVLMNSVNKGVLVSGEQAKNDNAMSKCVLEGTSWRELADIQGNAMVGCFNYQGKTALYVVNYDMVNAQNIKLTFQGDYKFSVVQDAKKAYYSGSEIQLPMQAGEGVLIVFEQ